jgi:arylformamidase
MNWMDVTRPLQPDLAGWPGDTPVRLDQRWSRARGDAVTVGRFQQSLHAGTHCDAPLHFLTDGAAAESLDPTVLCGPALVIDVRGQEVIELSHKELPVSERAVSEGADSEGADSERDPVCPQRVLLRTDAWPESRRFPARIPVLSLEAIGRLGDAGVRVVGVDLPSVDPLDCPGLANHHALHRAGIVILEGLDLTQVSPGHYEMLALPLLIPGADGAPVRALLKPWTGRG